MCYSLPCFYLTLEYAAQVFSPCRPDFLSVLEWEAARGKVCLVAVLVFVVFLLLLFVLFCFLKKPFSSVNIK